MSSIELMLNDLDGRRLSHKYSPHRRAVSSKLQIHRITNRASSNLPSSRSWHKVSSLGKFASGIQLISSTSRSLHITRYSLISVCLVQPMFSGVSSRFHCTTRLQATPIQKQPDAAQHYTNTGSKA